MIVVTGAPRTGTSLMMQTLQILQYPIIGEAFSSINVFQGNIKGYWELPEDEISKGITDVRYNCKAVKLFASGLYRTKEFLVDKVIYCERDVSDSVMSFFKLLKKTPIRMEPTLENAEKVVKTNKELIEKYLTVCTKPVFRVSFEGMRKNPEPIIRGICDFIGKNQKKDIIQSACDNVIRGK